MLAESEHYNLWQMLDESVHYNLWQKLAENVDYNLWQMLAESEYYNFWQMFMKYMTRIKKKNFLSIVCLSALSSQALSSLHLVPYT